MATDIIYEKVVEDSREEITNVSKTLEDIGHKFSLINPLGNPANKYLIIDNNTHSSAHVVGYTHNDGRPNTCHVQVHTTGDQRVAPILRKTLDKLEYYELD